MTSTEPDFTFTYHAAQRKRFRSGKLAEQWRAQYPDLFDDNDLKLLTTAHQRQYHFFEWLSAILIYEATGYLSLVESYVAKTHPAKRALLESLVGSDIFSWLDKHQSGQPDLFVYRKDPGAWYFCEVKGGPDRFRDNQEAWFQGFRELMREQRIAGQRLRVIQLRKTDFD